VITCCVWTKNTDVGKVTHIIVNPPPIGKQSIVMSVSVRVCVCLSVHDHNFGTTHPIFTNCFMHVTYSRGSILLLRRSDMLCTSGFMDDWMMSHLLIS